MRGSTAAVTVATALVLNLGFGLSEPARAACCIEGCGGVPIPWVSCGILSCTGGDCPSPIGSAIFTDPNATCGEGPTFSGCPPNEIGQCADGVNNDAWTGDLLTDCNDPDCASDPLCPTESVPAASGLGLAATAMALLGMGVAALRSRMRA